jgi:hypothetical protein
MKRFFLSSLAFICIGHVQAQNPMQEVLKSYFRTHPFDMRFSSFITSLQQDPWFTVEEYSRRTDTSFFYLTGTYKNFNPFRYPAKEIRLIIAEGAYTHNDSLKTLDTIINIQLLGITDGGSSNHALVMKEFNRFDKIYSGRFWRSNYDKFEKGNEITAEVISYFIFPFSIAPISSAWGKMLDSGQYTFTITIRCKLKQNIADLILTPAESKPE